MYLLSKLTFIVPTLLYLFQPLIFTILRRTMIERININEACYDADTNYTNKKVSIVNYNNLKLIFFIISGYWYFKNLFVSWSNLFDYLSYDMYLFCKLLL